MDPFDRIARETVEQFGLFEKAREKWHDWREERLSKKAERHGEKADEMRQTMQDDDDGGRRGIPRRHMTRAEHEAMMDERDGRPRRPRRRRRRRPRS